MKFLCALLALLVLTLSVQPVCAAISSVDACCCPEMGCTEDRPDTEYDHGNGCSNVCNPFQVCACCAFCVVVPQQLTFFNTPQLHIQESKWGMLPVGVTDEPVSGSWKPPRLA